MKLWLDDKRQAPEGWVLVMTVDGAIALIAGEGQPTHASLDHDLGWNAPGGDGDKLTDWMAENDTWPSDGIRVHSANPGAVQTMLATVDRYAHYPEPRSRFEETRGTAPEGGWPDPYSAGSIDGKY
jgi:hypothetical protein